MLGKKSTLFPICFCWFLFCFFKLEEAQLELHEVLVVRELYCLQESHPFSNALVLLPLFTGAAGRGPGCKLLFPVPSLWHLGFSVVEDRMALAQSILCLAALQNGAEREKQRSQGCMCCCSVGGLPASVSSEEKTQWIF